MFLTVFKPENTGTKKEQVTHFCLFPWVGAAAAAVLFDPTWGYSWGWSARSRCEDAPYVTNSDGQCDDTSGSGRDLMADAPFLRKGRVLGF